MLAAEIEGGLFGFMPMIEMLLGDFAVIEIWSGAFWLSVGKIMASNIVLSGDNAVVIAMASHNLPDKLRNRAIFFGSLGAILLRVIFCAIIGLLLGAPYLKLVGGALLLWIGIKLVTEEEGSAEVKAHVTLWAAITTIVVADAVMSLDNAIAIAVAAHGNFALITIGLLLSIPIIIVGASLISKLLDRYSWIGLAGAALIGWIARRGDRWRRPLRQGRRHRQARAFRAARLDRGLARLDPSPCRALVRRLRGGLRPHHRALSRGSQQALSPPRLIAPMGGLDLHFGEAALLALTQVVLIDLVMSGDNAIIIGMAVAGLPKENRTKIIFWGVAGATILRILFAALTTELLQIIGLTLAGGLLLLWVAYRMYRELRAEGPAGGGRDGEAAAKPKTTRQAMIQIIAADVSMSLDNVLAVAGAARDHKVVLWIGLVLSIVLMALASNAIASILDRYHWIAWIGFAIILYVAGDMIWDGTHEVVAATGKA